MKMDTGKGLLAAYSPTQLACDVHGSTVCGCVRIKYGAVIICMCTQCIE